MHSMKEDCGHYFQFSVVDWDSHQSVFLQIRKGNLFDKNSFDKLVERLRQDCVDDFSKQTNIEE